MLETSKKRCLTVGRRSRDFNHCRVTVQRLFSKFSQIAWTSKKRCLTVGRRSRDLRPLSRDRSATFSKKFLIAWNVEKSLFDSRPTVAWPPTTVAWPFSDFLKKFLMAWNVEKTLIDSRPTVAWPPTTVAWLFSGFLSIFRYSHWKFVWKPVKSRLTVRLYCFRGFCERLPQMLASMCLSRYYYYYFVISRFSVESTILSQH